MADTSIILVNWNGRADTLACLQSLRRLDGGDFGVVVVDNGSADGSVEAIAAWAREAAPPGWLQLVEAGANLGFAAANNLGMELAKKDPECRYFWLLNNDTEVAPDCLAVLRARMEADSTIGLLGARLMFHHQPDRVQGLGGAFHLLRGRGEHIGLDLAAHQLPPQQEVEARMDYVMGASIFARRAAVEAMGGMEESYFLYFEELDWARRLPARWRQAAALDAVVWHKEGGSIGSDSRARPSDTSLYYLTASLLRFYARHHRALLPFAALRLARETAGHLLRRDGRALKAQGQALADVLAGRTRRGRYGSAEFWG